MGRRDFVLRAAGSLLATAGIACSAPSRTPSSGVRITRISAFQVQAPRWKYVGSNAFKASHGWLAIDTILRLETNAGVEGVGPTWAQKEQVVQVLGRDPLAYFSSGPVMRSPLGRYDSALWDLVAKLQGRPVWSLLGGRGTEWVPVYDGSFYFSDLDPPYAARGTTRILEEIDHAVETGHRAFKLKIGRGLKWMETEAGFRRDIEVSTAVRGHLPPDMKVMVDANNAYDLPRTKRFLEEVGPGLFFIEEMFRERVEQDLELKEWLRSRGWPTLVADGETVGDPAVYAPFIRARAIDVLQGNIHVFGLQQLLELSRATVPAGITLAPNNWDSVLGLHLQLALGRGIPNLLMAEEDPGRTPVFDLSAFELREGRRRVPDTPGCGWQLRPEKLESAARHLYTVTA